MKRLITGICLGLFLLVGTESSRSQSADTPPYVDTQKPGDELKVGEALYDNRGFHKLLLQTDGNLVLLVRKVTGTEQKNDRGKIISVPKYSGFIHPVWSTQTGGRSVVKAAMQKDGNFVLYDKNGKAAWYTKTSGHPNSKLVVQADGNIVIYGPTGKQFSTAIWNSNTVGK